MREHAIASRINTQLSSFNPGLYFLSVLLGILAGILQALVVPMVLYALKPPEYKSPSLESPAYSFFASPNEQLAILFVVVCLLILMARTIANILASYLVQLGSVRLRIELYDLICRVPIERIEKIGTSRITSMFNVDIIDLTSAALAIPRICVSCVTVVGVISYLYYLDERIFKVVAVCMILSVAVNQIMLYGAQLYLRHSRDVFDKVQEGIRGLVFGVKELRLNRRRRKSFISEDLVRNETHAVNSYIKGNSIVISTTTLGDLSAFLIIGIVTFHLRYVYVLDETELIGVVMILLYITGPISNVLNNIPTITKGKIARLKIEELCSEMQLEPLSIEIEPKTNWSRLTLRNASFRYPPGEGEESFGISPANISFRRGQITFIVGGNGSGKSTLSKVVSLHYIPTDGSVYFDDDAVTDQNREAYRQCIAAVYTDFHIFRKIYDLDEKDIKLTQDYLRYLNLHEKVQIEEGEFSTTALSSGQRKRLALLVALMEKRQVYVFDEWAADQDPEFKEFFYRDVLSMLRSRNSVVVAITHDDRYFGCADQIFRMDAGEIV